VTAADRGGCQASVFGGVRAVDQFGKRREIAAGFDVAGRGGVGEEFDDLSF